MRSDRLHPPSTVDYRWRDLLLAPSLLSLARIPLAVCFVLAIRTPALALGVLVLAAISDVLDGYVARRYRLVSATGAALDGVTDKLFVLGVAVALVLVGHLPVVYALLLSTREIAEAPLVVWFVANRTARERRVARPMANALGKLATVLQFAAVGSALFRLPGVPIWAGIAACTGAAAAFSYYRRELSPLA